MENEAPTRNVKHRCERVAVTKRRVGRNAHTKQARDEERRDE